MMIRHGDDSSAKICSFSSLTCVCSAIAISLVLLFQANQYAFEIVYFKWICLFAGMPALKYMCKCLIFRLVFVRLSHQTLKMKLRQYSRSLYTLSSKCYSPFVFFFIFLSMTFIIHSVFAVACCLSLMTCAQLESYSDFCQMTSKR